MAGRDPDQHVVRDQPRRQHAAADEERRLPGLRRSLPVRRPPVRRPGALPHPRAFGRPGQSLVLHRLRRRHPRHAARRPHGDPLPGQRSRPAVRRRHRRWRLRRRLLTGLLLGCRGRDHAHRLEPGDPDPLHLAALPEGRPADLGRHALPEPPARFPLPVLDDAAAEGHALLHLPLERAARPHAAAERRPSRGGALRERATGRDARQSRERRSRAGRSTAKPASTSSGRPVPGRRSTPR